MRSRIVKIGNSQGVRIPKPLIEEAGLEDEVEISVRPDGIVIAPVRDTRDGWEDSFRAMAEHGDDALLDGDAVATASWDGDDWQWE